MKSDVRSEDRDLSGMNQLQTARILNVIVALSYPAGGFLLQFYFGASSDPWWLRILLMAVHFTVFVLSYRNQTVISQMQRILSVLFYAATLHAFYLLQLYRLSPALFIYLLIVFSVVSSFFVSRASLVSYLVFATVCAAGVGILSRAHPYAPALILIMAALSCTTYLLQNARLQLISALDESEKRFRALFDAAFEGLVLHENGKVLDINPAITRMFGLNETDLRGKPLTVLVASSAREAVDRHVDSNSEEPIETVGLRETGGTFHLELMSRLQAFQGRPIQVTAFRDITERKRAEETIAQQVHRDPLTELPSRRLFVDRLGVALAQAKRRQEGVAILHLDIDNLKAVNETYGHDTGDLVLLGAAARMKKAVRETDTVARLGGDEFIFVLASVDALGARITAEKLIDSFADSFSIHGVEHQVSVSIGISLFPEDGDSAKILMNKAHIALSAAKGQQRSGSLFMLFTELEQPG